MPVAMTMPMMPAIRTVSMVVNFVGVSACVDGFGEANLKRKIVTAMIIASQNNVNPGALNKRQGLKSSVLKVTQPDHNREAMRKDLRAERPIVLDRYDVTQNKAKARSGKEISIGWRNCFKGNIIAQERGM